MIQYNKYTTQENRTGSVGLGSGAPDLRTIPITAGGSGVILTNNKDFRVGEQQLHVFRVSVQTQDVTWRQPHATHDT